MRSGKKILVVMIVILILLLTAGGVFAYVYMATDILKTDRELFLKYFAQITSSEEGFIEKGISDFNEKKNQTPFENTGEITFIVQAPEVISENIMDKVNNLSIIFSGKVDYVNEKVEQNIKVDYGNDVIFPVNYRQDGNKIGLQFDELSKQFIAVRNENLKEFAQKFGVEDVSEIPNEIDFSGMKQEIDFSEEEIEQLKQIYATVLQQQLLDENFTSIKTEQNETYTLELNNEQIKNIIVKMLEVTKQNTLLIDKLNEIILEQDPEAEKIEVSDIDELIESINEEDVEDMPNLKLTLIQSNKQLNQIIIQSGESQITIAKIKEQDNLSYEINCEMEESEENGSNIESNVDNDSVISVEPSTDIIDSSESIQTNLYFRVQYTGLENLNNIQENYEIGFNVKSSEESMGYDYKINNNTQFNNSISIESLDNSVAVFLNDHNEEQVINFLTQVETRLLAINKMQMEKLGLKEYENPLLYTNPITSLGLMIYNMATQTITDTTIYDYEIEAFNTKFTNFVGEEKTGSEVNAMIKTVQNSNLSSELENGRFVKVTLDGIEITGNVDSSKTYTIEAVYDDEGYIAEMKVTTK